MTAEQQFRLAIEKMPPSRRSEAWEAWHKLKSALQELYTETQDWQDALGDERPSLIEARANARAVLGGEYQPAEGR